MECNHIKLNSEGCQCKIVITYTVCIYLKPKIVCNRLNSKMDCNPVKLNSEDANARYL